MRNSGFTLKAYTAALLTLLLGVVLSLELGDWGWFSRCGSLVVINGIILTSHQIIEHMQHLSREQRRDAMVNRDWAAEDKHHFLHDDHELRWRSEKYGLYMLIIGTLVWGFGDLINQL
jgi:ABC-type phosphate transport system permease subunit